MIAAQHTGKAGFGVMTMSSTRPGGRASAAGTSTRAWRERANIPAQYSAQKTSARTAFAAGGRSRRTHITTAVTAARITTDSHGTRPNTTVETGRTTSPAPSMERPIRVVALTIATAPNISQSHGSKTKIVSP